MQQSVTQFLKDCLSGGEDSRAIQDALVIPISKGTTLARARDDIDRLFDRAEKLLVPEGTRQPRRQEPHRRQQQPPAVRLPGRAYGAIQNNADGIGLLAGMALGLVVPKAREVVADATNAITTAASSASDWLGEQATHAREAVSGAWSWLGEQAQNVATTTASWAKTAYQSVSSFVSDTASRALDSAVAWGTKAASAVKGIVSPVRSDSAMAPDSSMPEAAVVQTRSSVWTFWEGMLTSLKRWLWSLFGIVQEESGNDGTVSGAGGSGGGAGGSGGGAGGSLGATGGPGGFGSRPAPDNHPAFTTSGSTIPGTNEPTSGVAAVDAKMAGMTPQEREVYRNTGQMDADVRSAYWNYGSAPTPGYGTTPGFTAVKPTGEESLAGTGPNGSVTAADIERRQAYVYQQYKSMGYTDKEAAAGMGNIKIESPKFDPRAVHWGDSPKQPATPIGLRVNGRELTRQDSLGLFQMNGDRSAGLVRFARNNGLDPLAISTQMLYHDRELRGIDEGHANLAGTRRLMSATGDVRRDTEAFSPRYEGYSTNTGFARGQAAVEFFSQMQSGKFSGYDFSGKTSGYSGGPLPSLLRPDAASAGIGQGTRFESQPMPAQTLFKRGLSASPVGDDSSGKGTSTPDADQPVQPAETKRPSDGAGDDSGSRDSGKSDRDDRGGDAVDPPADHHRKRKLLHSSNDAGLLVIADHELA